MRAVSAYAMHTVLFCNGILFVEEHKSSMPKWVDNHICFINLFTDSTQQNRYSRTRVYIAGQ